MVRVNLRSKQERKVFTRQRIAQSDSAKYSSENSNESLSSKEVMPVSVPRHIRYAGAEEAADSCGHALSAGSHIRYARTAEGAASGGHAVSAGASFNKEVIPVSVPRQIRYARAPETAFSGGRAVSASTSFKKQDLLAFAVRRARRTPHHHPMCRFGICQACRTSRHPPGAHLTPRRPPLREADSVQDLSPLAQASRAGQSSRLPFTHQSVRVRLPPMGIAFARPTSLAASCDRQDLSPPAQASRAGQRGRLPFTRKRVGVCLPPKALSSSSVASCDRQGLENGAPARGLRKQTAERKMSVAKGESPAERKMKVLVDRLENFLMDALDLVSQLRDCK